MGPMISGCNHNSNNSFFLQLKDTHSLLCSQFSSDFAYSCYGSFLRSFIAGWEDEEKLRAYYAIKGMEYKER